MSISVIETVESNRKQKWTPKTWRIEYDRIVGYKAGGLDNTQIAEKLNFTKEYVSLILNLPEAKLLYDRIKGNVRKNLEVDIPTRLQKIAEKAVGRFEQMIDDDELYLKNPFSVLDRGMDILKAVGYVKGGGNGSMGNGDTFNIQNNILTTDQKSDLMEGFEKIAEVHRLHSGSTNKEKE